MKKYCVPVGPIFREVDRFCDEHGLDLADFSDYIWPGANVSRIYKLREQDEIDFDLADKILAKCGMTILWIEDPELAPAYQMLDFAALDIARPVSSELVRQQRDEKVKRVFELCEGSMAATARVLGVSDGLVKKLVTT